MTLFFSPPPYWAGGVQAGRVSRWERGEHRFLAESPRAESDAKPEITREPWSSMTAPRVVLCEGERCAA